MDGGEDTVHSGEEEEIDQEERKLSFYKNFFFCFRLCLTFGSYVLQRMLTVALKVKMTVERNAML